MKVNRILGLLSLVVLPFIPSCQKSTTVLAQYQTQNVVLVSVDGARWSETWGDTTAANIPWRKQVLYPQGQMWDHCYNDGYTYTSAGHTAMLTGYYQALDNTGLETPLQPNIFQYYRWATDLPAQKTWIISSKDKIEALANCRNTQWKDRYLPSTDCGIAGLGTGYREDSITYRRAIEIFKQHRPKLTLVHFRNPDYAGHQGDWQGYVDAVKNTDSLVGALWEFLQADSNYSNKTTLILTNDHGRHLDGISNGFISHGDGCEGCRHIELMILGPDVLKQQTKTSYCQLRDIPSTIAQLLHFEMYTATGKPIPAFEQN